MGQKANHLLLLVGVAVTPLDVVRVRLQSQQPVPSGPAAAAVEFYSSPTSLGRANSLPLAPLRFQPATAAEAAPELGVTACCREVFWLGHPAEPCLAASTHVPTATHLGDSCLVEQTARRRFEGTWEGLVKIARYEGVASLWRGLSPTLVMAVPSNVIYYTGYDWLRGAPASPLAAGGGPWGREWWAPLLAGSAARAIAATAISPLELFKTRLQAGSGGSGLGGAGVFADTLRGVRHMVAHEGVRTLWRGLGLTLWRDVPFSGVYWFGYERARAILRARRAERWAAMHRHPSGILPRRQHPSDESTFLDAFVAGASSGAVAAFLTQPYDVGKTRRQIVQSRAALGSAPAAAGPAAASMPRVLLEIWREGGLQGLWKGCTPRMLKVAPACAIMVPPPFLAYVLAADRG